MPVGSGREREEGDWGGGGGGAGMGSMQGKMVSFTDMFLICMSFDHALIL